MKPTNKKGHHRPREKREFDQLILDLARVTRVTKGGKQLSFRVSVLLGDHKGRVGLGVAKGKDVQIGVEKAVRKAKKTIITVPIVKGTIPHAIKFNYKIAQVLLKPAPKGSGIIAGGALRSVLDLAGIPNVSGKILSKSKNKMTIAKAALGALQSFKKSAASAAKTESTKKDKQKPSRQKTGFKPVDKKNTATKGDKSDKK